MTETLTEYRIRKMQESIARNASRDRREFWERKAADAQAA